MLFFSGNSPCTGCRRYNTHAVCMEDDANSCECDEIHGFEEESESTSKIFIFVFQLSGKILQHLIYRI